MTPKLSIVTVCYNEPNLERTCESIVRQTWQDFEWIVIDGGSNAETLAVFEKYKDRIDTFVSEKDTGIYNAMNKGIRRAKGQWLNFMNAGDMFFYDDALKDVFQNKEYDADVLYGFAGIENRDRPHSSQIASYPERLTKMFFGSSCLCHQSTFIRRPLFERFGGYDETYRSAADYEKWLLFLKNGVVFQRVPYIVSCFFLGGMSSSPTGAQEMNAVMAQYFTEDEIAALVQDGFGKPKYTFRERLFSFKTTRRRKILTVLGLHIKWKNTKRHGRK
jgi:glycosyltransferase involved in cell wall biosynthesis